MTELEDLSTQAGAYWFGYLLMRGRIEKNRYRITCTVPPQDTGHLHNLIRDLRSIAIPKKRYQNGTHSRSYLYINNKALITKYRAIGWDDFKNGKLDNFCPTNLQHFLRGAWDARGIIYPYKKGLRVGIRDKNRKIIVWFSDRLCHLEINDNSPTKRNHSYYVWWQGSDAVEIARYLYCNSTRYLGRKARLAMKHIVRPQCAKII